MDIKQRIICEAGKLFSSRGVKCVTMDDIASSAGISKKTIYEHFTNKKDLLAEFFDEHFRQIDEKKKQLEVKQTNPILLIVLAITYYSLEIRRSHIQFLLDTEKYYPDVYEQKVGNRQKMVAKDFENFIDQGKKDGLFLPDAPTKVLAVLSHELLKMLGNQKLFPIEEYKDIDIFKDTYLMLMRGIVTDKGRQLIEEALKQSENSQKICDNA